MNMTLSPLRKAKGVVLVLVALSLVLLMGMAGLAIDLSHAELNKTRLQNAVDAAALAGAKVLNDRLGSFTVTPTQAEVISATTLAKSTINTVFYSNYSNNTQLNQTITPITSTTLPTVEVSDSLITPNFITLPSNAPIWPLYVRVTSPNADYQSWFMQVWGQATTNVQTTAVAGVASVTCATNLTPVMLCALGPKDDGSDSDKIANNPGTGTWGYNYDERIQLDYSTKTGNFHFLDFTCTDPVIKQQNKCLAAGLAGATKGPNICLNSGQVLKVSPGPDTGETQAGINARFGIYGPPLDSSTPATTADTNLTCYSINTQDASSYNNYLGHVFGTGIADPNLSAKSNNFCDIHKDDTAANNGNRVLTVPIADCSGLAGASQDAPLLDIGCLFLDVPADDTPGLTQYCDLYDAAAGTGVVTPPGACTKQGKEISARFVHGCNITGFSGNAGNGAQLKTVQLYKNPGSNDS